MTSHMGEKGGSAGMSGHTRGPWRSAMVSEKSWNVGVYDADGEQVALVKVASALHSARRDADARLIAAAPDMLAALRRAVLALAFASETSAAMHDDYQVVSAAIDKATGSAAT